MKKDYNGWRLFDKVIIVCKQVFIKETKSFDLGAFPQAYIVDSGNDIMLENARNWSVSYGDSIGEKAPGIEIETDNSGFSLRLLEAANSSSQGGKLSFWNCIISKDGKSYKVGISADILIDLLLNSTFVDGACKEEVFFVRKNGNLGVMHKDMPQYKEALNDLSVKESLSKKKTKKWIVGHNYVTLNTNDTYLGEVYGWFDETYSAKDRCVIYTKLKSPEKLNIMLSNIPPTSSKLSECGSNVFVTFTKTLPSRSEGGHVIELDIPPLDFLKEREGILIYTSTKVHCCSTDSNSYSDELVEQFRYFLSLKYAETANRNYYPSNYKIIDSDGTLLFNAERDWLTFLM